MDRPTFVFDDSPRPIAEIVEIVFVNHYRREPVNDNNVLSLYQFLERI